MAYVVEISNPFEPNDRRVSDVPAGITVRQWLKLRFGPEFEDFKRPTIIAVNGFPLLRRNRSRVIEEHDVLEVRTLPGDPVTILYVFVALLIVSTVVLAITMRTQVPNTGQTPEADPTYSLRGKRNQVRLGEPIEVAYGRNEHWPSYAAAPYNKYQNNEQWRYELFCLGQGQFVIESRNIETTPIENFPDVECEVYPPGVPVTLFPDNVITSADISNIELFGVNEPEADAVWIEDSPGDDTVDPPIDPTGHYGYSNATPFVANPVGTQTNKIEIDLSLPRGLYLATTNNNLANQTVTAIFEAREIDDSGTPVGDWFELVTFAKTLATVTPQRYTLEATVTLGRYEVRGSRTNAKNTSAQAGGTLQWEQLRAFLPSTRDYGNVTMIALKARASNNLNDNAANRFNVVAVRMLPYYADGAWQDPAPTRSIVWAMADVFRNQQYGGRMSDNRLDIDNLIELDAFFEEREEFCDWIFDQRLTVWEAAKLIALLGRAVPMPNGTRIGMVRSEEKTVVTTIYNQEVILTNSLSEERKFFAIDDYDGLEVEYIDPDTFKPETVLCTMDDEDGDTPEKIKLNGCSSRQHAFLWGMWKRGIDRYNRKQIKFATGLEGRIPSYGDLIGISHDVLKDTKGGFVTHVASDNKTLTLSEPVTFGVGTHKIILRKKNGDATDGLVCTAGTDSNHVVLDVAYDFTDFVFALPFEPPLFSFGKAASYIRKAIVSNLTPRNDKTVEVSATSYRSEPFSFDERTASAKGDTAGNLTPAPAIPSVVGLIVARSANLPNEVIATWQAARGALYYVLDLSYDGTSWERLSTSIETTSFRFGVMARFIYVRVAAVTTGQGAFAYWVGDAPVTQSNIIVDENLTPDPVSGVVLTAGFGTIWLKWVDPTNIERPKIKGIKIYVTNGSATGWDTKPVTHTFLVRPGQQFWADSGLADNVRRNYWFTVESIFDVASSDVGPVSSTTINGITLDHLIPGGLVPPEIVSVLPSTGNYKGRLVYLTAVDSVGGTFPADKLYRWTGLGTYASPVTGKTDWTFAATSEDLATDSVIAGKIAAAAVTAYAIGANEIITNTANIADAIITNAKIVSLDAAKINAGILNAMTLTAAQTATDSIFFNPGNGANWMKATSFQNNQVPATPVSGLTAGLEYWMVTFNGWDIGSAGLAADRFGKSDMLFICLENGGCTPSVSGFIDLVIIFRVNGGSTQFANPYAVRAISGNGSLNINGSINITGLTSTDVVEFGVKVTGSNSSDQFNVANLTVTAYNI